MRSVCPGLMRSGFFSWSLFASKIFMYLFAIAVEVLRDLRQRVAADDRVRRLWRLQRGVDRDVGRQVLVEGVDVLDLDPHLVLDGVVGRRAADEQLVALEVDILPAHAALLAVVDDGLVLLLEHFDVGHHFPFSLRHPCRRVGRRLPNLHSIRTPAPCRRGTRAEGRIGTTPPRSHGGHSVSPAVRPAGSRCRRCGRSRTEVRPPICRRGSS